MSPLVMPLGLLAVLLLAGPVTAQEDGSGSGDGSGWDAAAPLLCLPPAKWDPLLGMCATVGKGGPSRKKTPVLILEDKLEWEVKEELLEDLLATKKQDTPSPTGAAEEELDDKEEVDATQERDYWKEDSQSSKEEEAEEMEENELEHERVQVEKITSLLEDIKDEEDNARDGNTSSFIGSKQWIYMAVGLAAVAGVLVILAVVVKYRKSAVATIKESSRPNPTVAKLLRQSPESKPILDEQEERLV